MIWLTAQEIKEKLTQDDIKKILETLGATIYDDNSEFILTDTICHCGCKPKLYYYKDTGMFFCYTECGSMDIISLVSNVKGYDIEEINKAIQWICSTCGIHTAKYEYGKFNVVDEKKEKISDWNFIRSYDKSKRNTQKSNHSYEFDNYNSNILNIFQPLYYQGWIDEGISIDTMKKYNISYCTYKHRIIIPHYDSSNNIIGIRGRALLERDIEEYGKYTPFYDGIIMYRHKISNSLYGLNQNMEYIKSIRKVMLVEGEKSVMQCDTMFGEKNFSLALCGMNLSHYQKDILINLGVKEVIVGLDKQYKLSDQSSCDKWINHIKKEFIQPLSPYMDVNVIWDSNNELDYKMSPTDKGKDVLLQLMKSKILVNNE